MPMTLRLLSVAALEGAQIFARAERDTTALIQVAHALESHFDNRTQ